MRESAPFEAKVLASCSTCGVGLALVSAAAALAIAGAVSVGMAAWAILLGGLFAWVAIRFRRRADSLLERVAAAELAEGSGVYLLAA
jgi:hypothetical protein